MANRNVPATPSQEELREKVNIKNVKNSEERETDNLNTNTNTNTNTDTHSDSLPTVSSAGAVSRRASSSSRSQTRIPRPIALGPSSSNFQMSSRKYTSILDITKPRQQSANDSGIQTDTSMSDPEPTAVSPIPSPVPSSLTLDEHQTLKELQRIVAEMEAEVAMADKEDGELGQLDAANADQTSLASDVSPIRDPDDLLASEGKSGPSEEVPAASKAQQDPLADEAVQESAQKPAADNVQVSDATTPQEEDPLAASEAHQEPESLEPEQVSAQTLTPDEAQVNVEKPEQKDPPVETTTNELVTDNQEMLKKQTQMEEPEPVKDLFEPIAQLDLTTTSEAVLVTQPSTTNSHMDGSVGSDRRMIHLEELLRNANNVELLRRLLQIGAEANLVESEPDFVTQESSAEDKDAETESVPETSTTTCTATGTEASTDEDAELIDNEDEDGADVVSQGFHKAPDSVVWRLLSGKMIHLACPILFCGFAAGLIYMSRKA
ncbi:hypothetical protein KR054_011325 [Drosophila jambulina]|nr:hypothetical protein KR054_011325 [Drosophila jambulina]